MCEGRPRWRTSALSRSFCGHWRLLPVCPIREKRQFITKCTTFPTIKTATSQWPVYTAITPYTLILTHRYTVHTYMHRLCGSSRSMESESNHRKPKKNGLPKYVMERIKGPARKKTNTLRKSLQGFLFHILQLFDGAQMAAVNFDGNTKTFSGYSTRGPAQGAEPTDKAKKKTNSRNMHKLNTIRFREVAQLPKIETMLRFFLSLYVAKPKTYDGHQTDTHRENNRLWLDHSPEPRHRHCDFFSAHKTAIRKYANYLPSFGCKRVKSDIQGTFPLCWGGPESQCETK